MKRLLAVILLVLGCNVVTDTQAPQLISGGAGDTLQEIATQQDGAGTVDVGTGEAVFIEWVDSGQQALDTDTQDASSTDVVVLTDAPPAPDDAKDVYAGDTAAEQVDTVLPDGIDVLMADVQVVPEVVVSTDTIDAVDVTVAEVVPAVDAYYPGKDSDKDGVDDLLEAALGTDPANPDSDGDGLSDGEEVAGKTSPLKADTDSDGLKDGVEKKVYGTDPTSADTDGDGLNDGLELGLVGDSDPTTKTDPSKKDTDGNGVSDGDEDKNKDGKKDTVVSATTFCSTLITIPAGMLKGNKTTVPDTPISKFYFGKRAVTVHEYLSCVQAGACPPLPITALEYMPLPYSGVCDMTPYFSTPSSSYDSTASVIASICAQPACVCSAKGNDNEPVRYAALQHAAAYCDYLGGRVPTYAEVAYGFGSAAANIVNNCYASGGLESVPGPAMYKYYMPCGLLYIQVGGTKVALLPATTYMFVDIPPSYVGGLPGNSPVLFPGVSPFANAVNDPNGGNDFGAIYCAFDTKTACGAL